MSKKAALTRVPRRWIVYRNDATQEEPDLRHLLCESCGADTECGLSAGDNRRTGGPDMQRWYTERAPNYRLPPCPDCLESRAWKMNRGYRGYPQATRG